MSALPSAPRLAVGSKNVAKVQAVLAAARHYWGEAAQVVGREVPSGVRAQPLGHEETQAGALARARGALQLEPGAALGLGLEGGVVALLGRPVMMGYVAITDGAREVVVPTVGTPLPPAWARALEEGAELRPFVQAAGLPYDYHQGVVGLLTRGALQRDDTFRAAVLTGLSPWVNPAPYEG
jgi:inosine/xanthosine triphosphatase